MAQRPRLSQFKRTDENYRTFYEQYTELEREAVHYRKPVQTKGELPFVDNLDGDICIVMRERVIYSWDESIQNWTPILGKNYDVPSGTIKRYRQAYIANGGETDVSVNFRYDTGEGTLDVYMNGLLQNVDEDYREIDEVTVRFNEPLEAGMSIVLITPYIIGETRNVTDLEKRLESIEFNHYQLMLTQYYSGKPVEAQGLAFDGFLNTNYIDFSKTSDNIVYDSILRSLSLSPQTVSKFQDTFDTSSMMNPSSSIYLRGSEITLPLKTVYEDAFRDSFEDVTKISTASTVYHNKELEYVTTDSYNSGGDHYFLGDFMGTTGNADVIGTSSSGDAHILNGIAISKAGYLYKATASHVFRQSINRPVHASSYETCYTRADPGYSSLGNIFYNSSNPAEAGRSIAIVASADRFYFLEQYSEGSGRYFQKLCYFENTARSLGLVYGPDWPSGLPSNTGGSSSTAVISQIGATFDRLMLRIDNKIFFIDPNSNQVKRELDFSNLPKKPNASSKQFTADSRYLYFMSWKSVNSIIGHYVEVFDIDSGEFINDVLVTPDYSSRIGMAYDWKNYRLVLGIGSGDIKLSNKSRNDYSFYSAYPHVIAFDSARTDYYELQSKPFYTNLPYISYKLLVDQNVNSGAIEYYRRIASGAWERIYPNTDYTYTNPNGAKEVSFELRAMMRSSVGSSTSPILREWAVQVKGFARDGAYVSKSQQLNLNGVTGGRVIDDKTIPQETSLQWMVRLDDDSSDIYVNDTGYFSTPSGLESSNTVLTGKLTTNNFLFSPVVRDITMQMFYVEAGYMESTVHAQAEEIKNVMMWVTSGMDSSYYTPYISRDGGTTWIEGVAEDTIQSSSGLKESKWFFDFKDAESERRQLKVKIVMNGAADIQQYGIMINTML